MTPQAFIDFIKPAAQASALRTKIPVGFTIAEAALESGWGGSELSHRANNLFGVKADASWHGAVFAIQTREYVNGAYITVPAMWRAYPGWLASIEDHANFLLDNRRYDAAFMPGLDAIAFTHAVAAAGYATDPEYASKIVNLMQEHKLC